MCPISVNASLLFGRLEASCFQRQLQSVLFQAMHFCVVNLPLLEFAYTALYRLCHIAPYCTASTYAAPLVCVGETFNIADPAEIADVTLRSSQAENPLVSTVR